MMHIPILDKFPVDAIVLQKRGKGLSSFIDKARFMEKEGVRHYELKKYGAKFRPSSFDDFVIQTNGRPLILLYEYQRDMLVPVSTADIEVIWEKDENGKIKTKIVKKKTEDGKEIDDPVPIAKQAANLHAVDEDMAFWGQMRRWKAEERHKDEGWFQRNKDFIMMAVVFVFFIIMSYLFMTSISETGHGIIDALRAFSSGAGVPTIPG